MMSFSLEDLGSRVSHRRGEDSIRKAAAEIGIGHATLSRIENGNIPDLETFAKICVWLGEDPTSVLGMQKVSQSVSSAAVQFRSKKTPSKDTASALAEVIISARLALIEMGRA
jgi:transcriptional regulator with XRE-family HTH domain